MPVLKQYTKATNVHNAYEWSIAYISWWLIYTSYIGTFSYSIANLFPPFLGFGSNCA